MIKTYESKNTSYSYMCALLTKPHRVCVYCYCISLELSYPDHYRSVLMLPKAKKKKEKMFQNHL